MKKIIAIATLLFIAVTVVSAQGGDIDNRDRFQIGSGGTYSNVYDAKGEEFNTDSKFGFTGGAFFTIPLGTYIGLQPRCVAVALLRFHLFIR